MKNSKYPTGFKPVSSQIPVTWAYYQVIDKLTVHKLGHFLGHLM